MATSTEHTGAMIALVPTEEDLDRLVIDGGEPRDELHLTLYYLGDAANIDDETRHALVTAVRGLLLERDEQPIHARAFGAAHWNPTSDNPAWVLNVGDASEGESLGYVRSCVTEALHDGGVDLVMPTQHTPWQPHICLIYSPDSDWMFDLESRLGDVTFDRVRLVFAGEVTDVPLGSPATVASSLGGDVMTDCAVYDTDDAAHFASTSVSDSPWNGAASRFTDEQYQRAAAACDSGDGTPKERCFLPHHEPDGTLNRSGVHAAAARINQLKGHDVGAVARARGHLRRHYGQLGEDVPDVLKAEVEDDETFAARVTAGVVGESGPKLVVRATGGVITAAGKPPLRPVDDAKSDCPEGSRMLPNGDCVSEDEYATRAAWYGVLVVEGVTTGDGREFSPDALSWADNALLRWQKESAHGGEHDVTVSVGRIDEVWRVGNQVMGRGVIDIESVDGFEIARRLQDNFAGGISIDADDIQDADVEFVWSEEGDGPTEDDPLAMLFGRPEKMIFHGGRVRAATLCDIPAFVEARIQLGIVDDATEALVSSASATTTSPAVVLAHQTPTVDDAWDSNVERRLPNILSLDQARNAYAWVDEPSNGRVARLNCEFLHHEIRGDEVLGANLTACAAGVAALRMSEHTAGDRAAIYAHLAGHLRDAGQEPPPLDVDVVTAAIALDDWRPDREWFNDPGFSVPTGITVTDEGRVYGHAAQWGECHIGHQNECITLPREDAHPYFMTGEVVCADGSRVAVGQVTVGTGHAPLSYRASHAAEHYDNTGAAVADVTVGNDRFGIWVAGAVRASVAASRVHELRASGRLSGDWRRIGGSLRLVGLLAVNVPGFPVTPPRARVASGSPTALVAAGVTSFGPGVKVAERSEDELNQLALRRVMSILTTRVHQPVHETEGA
jgi:2'-5' RNA ligase